MSTLDASLKIIRRVVRKVGMVETARLSGVPYSTLAEATRRGFNSRAADTLSKLAAFAEAYESEHGPVEEVEEPEGGQQDAAA